jgi:hypothetical protein
MTYMTKLNKTAEEAIYTAAINAAASRGIAEAEALIIANAVLDVLDDLETYEHR